MAWRMWEAPDPWGALFLIHGLGEHSGRYTDVASYLANRGLSTFAFDLRGHGESPGKRGDVRSFSVFLDDVVTMEAEWERQTAGDAPRFLLGHSLGGLIALKRLRLVKGPYSAAVLSAPWLSALIPGWLRLTGTMLGAVAPRVSFRGTVEPERLTRDPEMKRRWLEDPLVHSRITAGLFRECAGAQRDLLGDLDSMGIPLLFLVPGADPVVDAWVTTEFAEGLPGYEVSVEHLQGFRHEPFNDLGRETVLKTVGDWLCGFRDSAGLPPTTT